MPTQSFKRSYSATTKEEFSDSLSELATNINQIQKEISYLDVYNITVAVSDPTQLESTISSLAPGSALVVNFTTKYASGNRVYKMGDVVLKTALGEEVYISSQVGGTYFPAQITQTDNSYTVLFQYYESQPQVGTTTLTVGESWDENEAPYEKIVFDLNGAQEEGPCYGFLQTIPDNSSTFSFNSVFYTPEGGSSTPIEPMIKFFIGEDEYTITEEIELEYSISFSDSSKKWTVSVEKPAITLYCVVK